MNITHYWLNKLIDFQFRAAALAKPTQWHIAAFTAAPDETGGGTEVAGGNYSRIALPPSDTNWLGTHDSTTGNSSGTSAQTSNAVDALFPVATADWGWIEAIGLYDAATLGNLCYFATLGNVVGFNGASSIVVAAPVYVRSGEQPRLSAGTLVITHP